MLQVTHIILLHTEQRKELFRRRDARFLLIRDVDVFKTVVGVVAENCLERRHADAPVEFTIFLVLN